MNVKILRSKYAIEGVRETGVAADDRNENEVVHAQDDLERGERHERQEPVRSQIDVHWVVYCRNIQIDGALPEK